MRSSIDEAAARSSADRAASVNEFAVDLSGRVDEAGRVFTDKVEALGDIHTASERINELVGVIDGIAFQTNLLALNASVEATRAGSACKGFALGANEVRALAQRSSSASQDIKTLIDEGAEQVARGVGLVETIGTTLESLVTGVREMSQAMGDLVATGRERAAGVGEVTGPISDLDAITQRNAALADESGETSARVTRRVATMRDLVQRFRVACSGGVRDAGPAPDLLRGGRGAWPRCVLPRSAPTHGRAAPREFGRDGAPGPGADPSAREHAPRRRRPRPSPCPLPHYGARHPRRGGKTKGSRPWPMACST